MLILRRIDADKKMARFYALTLAPSLFGQTVLIRRWGRIGTYGQCREEWFEDPALADLALARLATMKARRGYRTVFETGITEACPALHH